MLKLDRLRATILAAVPRLQQDPAQVIVLTGEDGRIISTGTDSRLSSQPRRSMPSASWIRPDSSASSRARPTRSPPAAPASGRMLAPTSRLVSATGPVDSWPQEPNRAATTAGTSAA